tara:strand:+ start:1911 stop:2165 length:255 start_codon:yes stop_codon:yes gene_type:complete
MITQQTAGLIVEYLIAELVDDDIDLDESTSLLNEGLIDSMNLVRLLGYLEQTFQVKIPVAEVNDTNFASAITIAALVESVASAT